MAPFCYLASDGVGQPGLAARLRQTSSTPIGFAQTMYRGLSRGARPRALACASHRNQYAFYRRIHKEIIVSVKVGRENQARSLLTCQARDPASVPMSRVIPEEIGPFK